MSTFKQKALRNAMGGGRGVGGGGGRGRSLGLRKQRKLISLLISILQIR